MFLFIAGVSKNAGFSRMILEEVKLTLSNRDENLIGKSKRRKWTTVPQNILVNLAGAEAE